MTAIHMLLIPAAGDIRLVEVDGFQQMAETIGAEYIEAVRVALEPDWSMAVDEEGLLRSRQVNERATLLYGAWAPIVGDVLLAREAMVGDGRDWVDTFEADAMAVLERRGAIGGAA